jgi:hypothetical protein
LLDGHLQVHERVKSVRFVAARLADSPVHELALEYVGHDRVFALEHILPPLVRLLS